MYDVRENARLDAIFQLNVKGETTAGSSLSISGSVIALGDGTTGIFLILQVNSI